MVSRAPHLWIVCKVIDNFGDAGVCWRLARQLAAEHPFEVSLIIDGEATLAAIEPSYSTTDRPAPDGALPGPVQLDGVDILPWQAVAHARPAQGPGPDIVISAFGCELPGWLRRLLGGAPRRPLWLNLEYLSAEPWIDDCHQLVSIKPDDGAREHFFYPGFSPRSGGLIRERSLAEQRDRFRAEGGGRALPGGPRRPALGIRPRHQPLLLPAGAARTLAAGAGHRTETDLAVCGGWLRARGPHPLVGQPSTLGPDVPQRSTRRAPAAHAQPGRL